MPDVDLRHVIAEDMEHNSGNGCLRAIERVLDLHPMHDETRAAVLDELHTGAPSPAPVTSARTVARPPRRRWVLPRGPCPRCSRDTAKYPNHHFYRHRCRPRGLLGAEEVDACTTSQP